MKHDFSHFITSTNHALKLTIIGWCPSINRIRQFKVPDNSETKTDLQDFVVNVFMRLIATSAFISSYTCTNLELRQYLHCILQL